MSWRVTENEITSTFSEGHLVSLLMTSCALSLQAYIAMSILVNDDNLANAIKEAHQNIFGYAEWHNK